MRIGLDGKREGGSRFPPIIKIEQPTCQTAVLHANHWRFCLKTARFRTVFWPSPQLIAVAEITSIRGNFRRHCGFLSQLFIAAPSKGPNQRQELKHTAREPFGCSSLACSVT